MHGPADGPTAEVWTLEVDPSRCIGTAVCVGTAPHLLALHEGRARPRASTAPAAESLHDLADACPTNAITVTEEPPAPEDRPHTGEPDDPALTPSTRSRGTT